MSPSLNVHRDINKSLSTACKLHFVPRSDLQLKMFSLVQYAVSAWIGLLVLVLRLCSLYFDLGQGLTIICVYVDPLIGYNYRIGTMTIVVN